MSPTYERVPEHEPSRERISMDSLLSDSSTQPKISQDEPVHELPVASSSSSARPGPSTSRPHIVGTGHDGVFSNMSAKPSLNDAPPVITKPWEVEPPSYAEATLDSAPSYMDTTVFATVGEDGEVLVEGMPVGSFFTFLINMMISMSFDIVGFLLTSMLAVSHAAKCGARCGLGITLIRYGFYLKSKSAEDEMMNYTYYDPDNNDDDSSDNDWLAYLMMIIGFFIIMRANADYLQAKRLQNLILSSSESVV
ncbi:uncharacterized protein BJ171DRAFT_44081 [Polychytrium aggregatum]|uniref:uncharacterized protein n=1 Tax=Polychytrium aggregatum TaxID=110093 RepID=UPI0022FEBE02|nr:uncharacterized protein BJ171DRAFT_44081 [Polychytrium aggregatum]KAI9206241.1 hypothetical protein BJ171DRAFT_44081 [Polychytrium aggregatum]